MTRELDGAGLLTMITAHASSDSSSRSEWLLLDVREPWEFAVAAIHVDGARTLHIPMNEIPTRLAELNPQQAVACICHHGARSAQVVAFLERQGFSGVYNLVGGIDAWSLQIDPEVPQY